MPPSSSEASLHNLRFRSEEPRRGDAGQFCCVREDLGGSPVVASCGRRKSLWVPSAVVWGFRASPPHHRPPWPRLNPSAATGRLAPPRPRATSAAILLHVAGRLGCALLPLPPATRTPPGSCAPSAAAPARPRLSRSPPPPPFSTPPTVSGARSSRRPRPPRARAPSTVAGCSGPALERGALWMEGDGAARSHENVAPPPVWKLLEAPSPASGLEQQQKWAFGRAPAGAACGALPNRA
ncbi:hypothetical protein PVAP13_8KG203400 [Panicum virgatum]|uniref:Uncharacterized protein n=1 Tax=Panicum virgatum TaxID=38727 RepID=A0A8T0PLH8_PANVG|nr:hypothetical protein PVAP13_8KG203400 [Panicum virgatum]